MPITIAIDAMGGDHGIDVTLPAVSAFLKKEPQAHVLLVGPQEQLQPKLGFYGLAAKPNINIIDAREVIAMDDDLVTALRRKRDSSMRVAVEQIKQQQAQAMVSAGNTGALMAISRMVLKTLPGIDRPAICTAIPTKKNHCYMLDLGANVEADAEHLLQFALMGNAVAQAVDGNTSAKIGLLNIGEEEIKGHDTIKAAAELLSQHPSLNYIGYVEGNTVFEGAADVVVCDGFVGNIALKTMEGVASMIGQMLKNEIQMSWPRKLAALLAVPILKGLQAQANPQRYNGATLVGLNGIVVKSHGGATVEGFEAAIHVAFREAKRDVLALISQALAVTEPAK